jgi:hypothetical protein
MEQLDKQGRTVELAAPTAGSGADHAGRRFHAPEPYQDWTGKDM